MEEANDGFVCDVCLKELGTESGLKTHKKVVHEKKNKTPGIDTREINALTQEIEDSDYYVYRLLLNTPR